MSIKSAAWWGEQEPPVLEVMSLLIMWVVRSQNARGMPGLRRVHTSSSLAATPELQHVVPTRCKGHSEFDMAQTPDTLQRNAHRTGGWTVTCSPRPDSPGGLVEDALTLSQSRGTPLTRGTQMFGQTSSKVLRAWSGRWLCTCSAQSHHTHGAARVGFGGGSVCAQTNPCTYAGSTSMT